MPNRMGAERQRTMAFSLSHPLQPPGAGEGLIPQTRASDHAMIIRL